eukprot:164270-Pyramimonas_sp.AAC.1
MNSRKRRASSSSISSTSGGPPSGPPPSLSLSLSLLEELQGGRTRQPNRHLWSIPPLRPTAPEEEGVRSVPLGGVEWNPTSDTLPSEASRSGPFRSTGIRFSSSRDFAASLVYYRDEDGTEPISTLNIGGGRMRRGRGGSGSRSHEGREDRSGAGANRIEGEGIELAQDPIR